MDTELYLRAGGAIIGSTIAVIFNPGDDTRRQLATRFLIGISLGYIFAPVSLTYFNFERNDDTILASSSFCGGVSYGLLQLAHRRRDVLSAMIAAWAKKGGGG